MHRYFLTHLQEIRPVVRHDQTFPKQTLPTFSLYIRKAFELNNKCHKFGNCADLCTVLGYLYNSLHSASAKTQAHWNTVPSIGRAYWEYVKHNSRADVQHTLDLWSPCYVKAERCKTVALADSPYQVQPQVNSTLHHCFVLEQAH